MSPAKARARVAKSAAKSMVATTVAPTPTSTRTAVPTTLPPLDAEWLETDGLGGFASGTVSGIRTRRYHALLLTATTPPTGRFALVNGMEVRVTTPAGAFDLSAQRYAPDVLHPDGFKRIESFTDDPWPRWVYRLEDGTRIEQELFSRHGVPGVVVLWRVLGDPAGVSLCVRLLLSGRDTHALHHENAAFRFDAAVRDGRTVWRPYEGAPAFVVETNATYMHHPLWYHQFLYSEEKARGLDHTEDLASPGSFHFDLAREEAALVLTADPRAASGREADATPSGLPTFVGERREGGALAVTKPMRDAERAYRAAFRSRLERAADAYIVRRGSGMTIVAGYPWFTDWGRDTFISLRGLCLATGRLEDARKILLEWAGTVSRGMLPNRFVEQGDQPEFNSVDASLWYVVAVREFLDAAAKAHMRIPAAEKKALQEAVLAILRGYADGTRHGIHADTDGLLASGEPGVQLTWMDAKVGGWVVTPRTGKAVEIQALWLNALRIGSEWATEWGRLYERALPAFEARFWDEKAGGLYDVIDVDHRLGTVDATFRPNQIFAVGGLPVALLEGDRARRLVDAVEARLLTPLGLRTLAPGEPGYTPRYEGGVAERDGSYHQGTVWPWLLGAFVEAWVRVRGGTAAAKAEARERFLAPLLLHLDEAGLGHLPEIADADPPHKPRGALFQAWSVAEAIRLDRVVLAE
jgi:predicted glycogen debranching enzyme